jgi:MFS family permease
MTTMDAQLAAEYAGSPDLQRRLHRRILGVVVVSQVFGGAGLAAGVTVGALLAERMLGTEGLAGLPSALFTLGSAGAAFGVGRISQRRGRRVGLSTGFFLGAVGAFGVVLASILGNVLLLFGALLVYGAGTATNLQARYAGTDLALPEKRATAVSIAMVSTTLGAVAGPNLVAPVGQFATRLGIPELAGPFLLAGVAYGLAGLVLLIWLRPDPFLLAQAIATHTARTPAAPTDESAPGGAVARRGVAVGTTVMVLTQVAMVAIMTMTPVHMTSTGHGLTAVGIIIGIHIGSMYLPSLVTGFLVDKVGRLVMSVASGVTLVSAGIVAATAPSDSLIQLGVGLSLLGIGWNFGLISGTALIVDATPIAVRARTQGSVDVVIALAGATGGAVSGMVMAGSSYAILSLGGGFLAILLIPVVVWSRRKTLTKTLTSG